MSGLASRAADVSTLRQRLHELRERIRRLAPDNPQAVSCQRGLLLTMDALSDVLFLHQAPHTGGACGRWPCLTLTTVTEALQTLEHVVAGLPAAPAPVAEHPQMAVL